MNSSKSSDLVAPLCITPGQSQKSSSPPLGLRHWESPKHPSSPSVSHRLRQSPQQLPNGGRCRCSRKQQRQTPHTLLTTGQLPHCPFSLFDFGKRKQISEASRWYQRLTFFIREFINPPSRKHSELSSPLRWTSASWNCLGRHEPFLCSYLEGAGANVKTLSLPGQGPAHPQCNSKQPGLAGLPARSSLKLSGPGIASFPATQHPSTPEQSSYPAL